MRPPDRWPASGSTTPCGRGGSRPSRQRPALRLWYRLRHAGQVARRPRGWRGVMAAYPRGTVTFLFTDREGSTRLGQAYPERRRAAYARHDALLRDAAATDGGVVYKVIGDALQIAFPTAQDALAAALAAQR